jgi:predicted CXXCH cytochrome family protein
MKRLSKKAVWWIIYVSATVMLTAYLGYQLVAEPAKKDFLIGETSHGHYQIELSCNACHVEPFGGTEVIQNACMDCHQEELKQSMDSHPKSKFTDPRNADLVSILDARYCVTCHVEHNPDVMQPMGVSLQNDFCVQCHQDIAEDRPSHKDLPFDSCATSGCHNYHDNTALYENFLLKHKEAVNPANRIQPQKSLHRFFERNPLEWNKIEAVAAYSSTLVKTHQNDQIHADWLESKHAQAGVACETCHVNQQEVWVEKPDYSVCASCHIQENKGFLSGKHGMRLAQGLPNMRPAEARLPMTEDSHDLQLECSSCHNPHTTDTRHAAVEACLGCHADEHSLAFKESPHGQLWEMSDKGELPKDAAVTCATCHLPRIEQEFGGEKFIRVEHNQNATLRPNEKMIRTSCMNCHSLAFSIDALADPLLINNNFSHAPSHHINSIDMAVERDIQANARKGGSH